VKKILLFALLLPCAFNAWSDSYKFNWATTVGTSDNEGGRAVATDKEGNIYSAIAFSRTLDADPGPGVFMLTNSSFRSAIALSKYDAGGNFIWAKKIEGQGLNNRVSLSVDSLSDVVVAGTFIDTLKLDEGAFTLRADSTEDIFVTKIDKTGNFIWAKQMGGEYNSSRVFSVKTDRSGHIYTIGTFSGGYIDFDPGAGTFPVTPINGDLFILKLEHDGSFIWVKSIGSATSYFDRASLGIDTLENPYICGRFGDTEDFDPSSSGVASLTATGLVDGFILKLNNAGNFEWVKQLSGTNVVTPEDITIDFKQNVYITGYFDQTCDFDPGAGSFPVSADTSNAFVLKLKNNGDFVWTRIVESKANVAGRNILADTRGNVFITGFLGGTADLDPGPKQFLLSANKKTSFGFFIQGLDSSGNFVMGKVVNSDTQTVSAARFAIDRSNNMVIIGNFTATTDFDPGSGYFPFSSKGNGDAFVLKLSPCDNDTASTPLSVETSGCAYTFNEFSYTESGTYFSTFSSAGGCDSMVRLDLKISKPIPNTLSVSGNTLSSANTGDSYEWVECPDYTHYATGTSRTIDIAKEGWYALILSTGTCKDTTGCVFVSGLSIREESKNPSLRILPNPGNGIIELSLSEPLRNGIIQISNQNGQLVYSNANSSGSIFQLDISAEAAGIYFLKIVSEQKVYKTEKLIKF
jgi:hypothetical protein